MPRLTISLDALRRLANGDLPEAVRVRAEAMVEEIDGVPIIPGQTDLYDVLSREGEPHARGPMP